MEVQVRGGGTGRATSGGTRAGMEGTLTKGTVPGQRCSAELPRRVAHSDATQYYPLPSHLEFSETPLHPVHNSVRPGFW